MKNKKILLAVAAVLAAAAILGAAIFLSGHVRLDGTFFPKDSAVYDLTEHDLTAEEYLQLCSQYPEAQILWTVPFQGSRYPMDTQSITVTTLSDADVLALDHLTALTLVDATGCTDYAQLLALQQRRPQCQVLYNVSVGDVLCSCTDEALTVTDATEAQLRQALPLLPNLRSLTLEGNLPQPEELVQLRADFPDVRMAYSVSIAGMEFNQDSQLMALSGTDVTYEALSSLLPLLDSVTRVELEDTRLSDSEYKELIRQFPEIFFLCTVDFAGIPFSTDATEIDISGQSITVEQTEEMIPCFPQLQKLIMSHCGIEDEAMDALNRRYPDISIVWTLQIGLVTLRTDAIYFYPAGIDESNLPSNEELQKLRYCTEMIAIDVGHSKATDCEWVRYMPHLKYLILADTLITDLTPLSTCKELIYLELFTMDITDYSPLLGCTALQDLNIGATYGDPEPLTQMTWLHMLSWKGVLRDPALRDRALLLPQQLPDTVVIVDSDGRNIGGKWRAIANYYVFRDIIGARYFNQDYIQAFWDYDSARKIMSTERRTAFAGDVLADIIRYKIDNGLPIVGIRNIGSEKAEILYQTLLNSQP